MLSKERLEELIEQKKSIYWKFAKIKPSSWSKYTIMGNTIVKGNLKDIYSLDDLFETKEDFEWHRQFGCITRTERLELSTWEEFDKKGYIEFVSEEVKVSCLICEEIHNIRRSDLVSVFICKNCKDAILKIRENMQHEDKGE